MEKFSDVTVKDPYMPQLEPNQNMSHHIRKMPEIVKTDKQKAQEAALKAAKLKKKQEQQAQSGSKTPTPSPSPTVQHDPAPDSVLSQGGPQDEGPASEHQAESSAEKPKPPPKPWTEEYDLQEFQRVLQDIDLRRVAFSRTCTIEFKGHDSPVTAIAIADAPYDDDDVTDYGISDD